MSFPLKCAFFHSMFRLERNHCDKSLFFFPESVYFEAMITETQINVLLLQTFLWYPVKNWNMLSFHSLASEKFKKNQIRCDHSTMFYFYLLWSSTRYHIPWNLVFNLSHDERGPYRKPAQTGKVKQSSHNTTTQPF